MNNYCKICKEYTSYKLLVKNNGKCPECNIENEVTESPGIVYLIQPGELLGTKRYKVGMSKNETIKRIKNYKTKTRILCILNSDNPKKLEHKIIKTFKKNFNNCSGNEYFEIEETEEHIKKIFLEAIINYEEIKNNLKIECNCDEIEIDIDLELNNKKIKSGKHEGKTYQEVRINHPSYLCWLMAQPTGCVFDYLDFIQYCLSFISI